MFVLAFIEATAFALLVIYAPLYLFELTREARYSTSVVWIPATLTFLLAPRWALWGRAHLTRLVRLGLAGYAANLWVLPRLEDPLAFLAVLALFSSLQAAFQPGLKTLIGQHGPQALGRYFAVQSAGWMLGSLLGGLFFERVGFLPLATAVGTLAALAVLLPLPSTLPPPTRPRRGLPPGVPSLLAPAFLVVLGGEAFFSLYSVYLTEGLQGPAALVGYSLTVVTFLGMLTSPAYGRWVERFGAPRALGWVLHGYLALYLLIALWPHPYVTAVLFAIPLYPAFQIATLELLYRRYPEARAEATGAFEAMLALALALGGLLAGAVADAFGLRATPWVTLLLVAAGWAWWHKR
ncbi:major facilitator superfamily MFS_1 [Marinithermus hydrothermalis DSM 14884]|uniref:Major facilitator superfamily MFS_1 n=1 Tax=Marinithermus hydrothermalis (strain DSM 14884 / JCM 11576 / T1) TaxID=869210 RepID=F2NQ43_MARHT|nr:major facilitator superfamily MFS_1 [Marinithermus hydrothermalis DSM 14884]